MTVPVLSSSTVSIPARLLEDLRPLDQDAELRAAARADHERGRRREAERAGARDDQHRDGRGERGGHVAVEREPARRASRARARVTIGTKTAETRSASRCTGALPACASATRRVICASAVSAPDLRRADEQPPVAVDGRACDLRPGPTSTGIDSPVNIDWSTADDPPTTTPSVAIFSPGRTTTRSPTCKLLGGHEHLHAVRAGRGPPSRRARASARIASPERRRARASRYRPSRISVVITAPTSK